MTRSLTRAALLLSALLIACNEPKPPVADPAPQPEPIFIPAAGAPVGSGNGTVIGTVRVSPTAEEVRVMELVNEVRTKGTVNGVNVIPGSCVDGTFQPGTLNELTYNGLLAHAARMHSAYMSEEGLLTHEETNPASPYFYGRSPEDRTDRSYALYGAGKRPVMNEAAAWGYQTPEDAMRGLMASAPHCRTIMDDWKNQGIGFYISSKPYSSEAWTLMFGE